MNYNYNKNKLEELMVDGVPSRSHTRNLERVSSFGKVHPPHLSKGFSMPGKD